MDCLLSTVNSSFWLTTQSIFNEVQSVSVRWCMVQEGIREHFFEKHC